MASRSLSERVRAAASVQSGSERRLEAARRSSRGAPTAVWEHHRAVPGVVRGAFRSAEEASAAETAIGFLKEFLGFRCPRGSGPRPKSLRSGLGWPRAACRSGFERVGAPSSARSGSAAPQTSANQPELGSPQSRKSIEVATHGLDLLDPLPRRLIHPARSGSDRKVDKISTARSAISIGYFDRA